MKRKRIQSWLLLLYVLAVVLLGLGLVEGILLIAIVGGMAIVVIKMMQRWGQKMSPPPIGDKK